MGVNEATGPLAKLRQLRYLRALMREEAIGAEEMNAWTMSLYGVTVPGLTKRTASELIARLRRGERPWRAGC